MTVLNDPFNDPAALFPFNSVHFDHGSIRLIGHELQKVFVKATNSASFVHLVLDRLPFAWFDASSEETAINIPIDGVNAPL